MGTPLRIGITVATALFFGAATFWGATDHEQAAEAVRAFWGSPAPLILYGAALVGVFIVYRWWALLPALAPLAVQFYLHELTDYVYPYHEDPYPALMIFGTFVLTAFLGVGLLARLIWESARSRLRPTYRM